ncbi:ALK3 [Mytilus edulis]|uniref:BMPR1A n=1 Tax=Mytilus edulis TaxID=6550 RepID=A0A8S3T3W9_MYTED|nr:ALK3 [Mytilus edulis]
MYHKSCKPRVTTDYIVKTLIEHKHVADVRKTEVKELRVCSIKKTTVSGGHIFWTLFEMGCMLEQSCSKIGSGFGRRSAFTPYCCKTNLCNDHQPLPPTTLMPTIPPNPYPHCWIDAVYSDSQHHWIWSHSSALIDYRSFTQLAHSDGKTSKCAFATYAAADKGREPRGIEPRPSVSDFKVKTQHHPNPDSVNTRALVVWESSIPFIPLLRKTHAA